MDMTLPTLFVFVFAWLEANWLRSKQGNRFLAVVLKRTERPLEKSPHDPHIGIPVRVSFSNKRLLLLELLDLAVIAAGFCFLSINWAAMLTLYLLIFIGILGEIAFEIERKIIYDRRDEKTVPFPRPSEELKKSA